MEWVFKAWFFSITASPAEANELAKYRLKIPLVLFYQIHNFTSVAEYLTKTCQQQLTTNFNVRGCITQIFNDGWFSDYTYKYCEHKISFKWFYRLRR